MSATSRNQRPSFQRGVSLVELMIALVIGLLLLGGLIQVYLTSKQSYNAQEQVARMQESGRFAVDLIARDLRRAGYWGGNVDTLSITGTPGRANPLHACGNTNAWGRMIEWRVTGLNNTNSHADGGYGDCADGYIAGTDILTIRYAGPELADPNLLEDNRLYLRSTLFSGRIITGLTEGNPENDVPPLGADTPDHLLAVVRPLSAHGYYIGDTGRTCNGETIPALFRFRLGPDGTPIEAEELAPGVEQLQVRYLLGEEYVDAGEVGTNWPNVRAVRFWLVARGECPEPGLNNTTTFEIGDDAPWPPAPDNFRRQLYGSTVMLRNTIVR
jgi:type IV pilus assembly protein PilW